MNYHHLTIEERCCLREFYPKWRNLSRVSPKTLLRNLALINARPRKVLGYVSAQDSWNLELKTFS